MAKIKEIQVFDKQIHINDNDYFSLTDIARYKNPLEPKEAVRNWLRRKDTIEYLGLWEQLNNPDFKGVEFDTFKNQAGTNAFTLSPERWIEKTNAIGIITKRGKYSSGTFAHKDIALQFASWISPEINLYIIKEFQRLKTDEQTQIGWNVKRELSKINYHIHTDAIKENIIIPNKITKEQLNFVYASEADMLNVALFGKTAGEWKIENPDLKGNMRDYADINQLICLSNLENINAYLIDQGKPMNERMIELNKIAIKQMEVLVNNESRLMIDKNN